MRIKQPSAYELFCQGCFTFSADTLRVKQRSGLTRTDDYRIAKHETAVPIMRVPALAFLYIMVKAEAEGMNGKL